MNLQSTSAIEFIFKSDLSESKELIQSRRDEVSKSFASAEATNRRNFLEGNKKASSEYIYPNQIKDAQNVVNIFYNNKRCIVSIQKLTKVGADAFMIKIAELMTTHTDDNFVCNLSNVRIITGMSNSSWEKDMIDKAPSFLKDKIFHHGKLSHINIKKMKNGLIIIDEIDVADKEGQKLNEALHEAGILNVKHMIENNNKILIISATIVKELYDVYRWGDLHENYKMTIPAEYIGHIDFLKMGIIKEFYPMDNKVNCDKWIQEDILDHYGEEYRVHILRVKNIEEIQKACIRNGIDYRNHTSSDRISDEELKELFESPLHKHIVLFVKGLLRRANLIPNPWKLRIGATHELYTKTVDNNVQVQGLPGRMSGYWRSIIESGHKTGPYRTSIKSIEEYHKIYEQPFGINDYQSSGFKKTSGEVKSKPTMLSPHNVGFEGTRGPEGMHRKEANPIITFDITDEECEQFNELFKLSVTSKIKQEFMMNKLKIYNFQEYQKYSDYKPHVWKMNTPDKISRWGMDKMLKDGAVSTTTNIDDKDQTKNYIMFYIHEKKIIINAWSGERMKE